MSSSYYYSNQSVPPYMQYTPYQSPLIVQNAPEKMSGLMSGQGIRPQSVYQQQQHQQQNRGYGRISSNASSAAQYRQSERLIPIQRDPAATVAANSSPSFIKKEKTVAGAKTGTSRPFTNISNDYANHYLHTGESPVSFVKNRQDPIEGYPKLQKLISLKKERVENYATKPFGYRCEGSQMVDTLNTWIAKDGVTFDVIMIGALTENQFIYPILKNLPLDKLCARPGFLFIWASTQKIKELSQLLSNESNTGWGKKFRRSEELIFVPVSKDSSYYPYKDGTSLQEERFCEKLQWHCWMCITGTVRRSTDQHLIHCNVNTDLAIENDNDIKTNNAVPEFIYNVAENFSNSVRRLHIIPSRTGIDKAIRVRPGWVIMSPDVMLNNFNPSVYKYEMSLKLGGEGNTIIPFDQDIENLRPKSPPPPPSS